jgi:hypothetical protein
MLPIVRDKLSSARIKEYADRTITHPCEAIECTNILTETD